MNLKQLFTDERAISPVVGVALLIAIAVILATVIGAVVLDLGPGGASTPTTDAAGNYSTSNTSLTVSHRGGDPLPAGQIRFVDESGNETQLSDQISDDELTAGESVILDGSDLNIAGGDTITMIWEAENSDKEQIIAEFSP